MNVRTVREFYDREAGVIRKVGDEFEAGDARVASLVHSLYGVLVEGAAGDWRRGSSRGDLRVDLRSIHFVCRIQKNAAFCNVKPLCCAT